MSWSLNQIDDIKDRLIGIAGAGGIGSNVARFLVQAGFKRFRIIDFDRVEKSNLNRQFFFQDQIGELKVNALKDNLLRLNPNLEIGVQSVFIDLSNIHQIFLNCDLVIEALDKKKFKQVIIESLSSDYLMVAVSGIAGNDLTSLKIKNLTPKLIVVGDFFSDEEENFLIGYKVSACAGLVCQAVFELFLNQVRVI